MEFISPPLLSVLALPVAIFLFLLPGWMLVKRWPTPAPFVAAFLASSAILFNGVLLLDALSIPLHAGTLLLALALPTAAFGWLGRKNPSPFAWTWPGIRPGIAAAWAVPPVIALVSIVARAVIDPLSGYDNGFRWDYLARLFLMNGSLSGYPPITAGDFEYYSWCDGIPPLVPLLNLWTYALTGSTAPVLTAVRVIGEALLLGVIVYRYSRLLWGDRAGGAALAVFATSALALWSIAMGQETGLTALSLVAMLYFLEFHAREPRPALVFWAAIAGSVGALSREYGLAFPAIGFGILALSRTPRARLVLFASTAGALTIPWYGRNALITGNPLYPQPLGGLFPGNAVHDESLRYFRDYWSLEGGAFDPMFIPRFLAVLCGLAVVAGLIGTWRAGRRAVIALLGVGLVTSIWFILILPQTGAGWVYSARALSPAIALCAVLGGWMGMLRNRASILVVLVACAASADAARRSWLLPINSTAKPWNYSFASWRSQKDLVDRISTNPIWAALATASGGRGVVVDHPTSHVLLTLQGGRAVPFFSPLLAPTFDERTDFATALRQLLAADIEFVTLSKVNPVTQKLVKAHLFWTTLRSRYRPNVHTGALEIYELDRLQPTAEQ